MKLTKLERAWVLYDVGNSAFTLLVATFFPIYFNVIAGQAGISDVDYLAYWGYATSVVTIIVALMGPICGTVADNQGMKKLLFAICVAVGSVSCMLLGLTSVWFFFLALYMIAKLGYSGSLIFYDAMLNDVTSAERMDDVSSRGFAWGYIGSCVPFVIGLCFVLFGDKIGIGQMTAMSIAFVISAVWWLLMTTPLIRLYQQRYYVEKQPHMIRNSFVRLKDTFAHMSQEKGVFLFLLAFFCYIDGVYTIIDMATAYGTALGLNTTGLLLALLVTQIVAFPSALVFGKLSSKYPSDKLIPICILGYTFIAIFAFWLDSQPKFWILAICVGLFQGGIQALSRSHFAKIIPPEKSGEYFGLFDICGKGASFIGTMLVSLASQLTGNINLGVGSLIILFVLGLILFGISRRYK